jgi:hypothetical protein
VKHGAHLPRRALEWYVVRVRVPIWVTLGVAAIVIVFGLYRIRLATRKPPSEDEAGKGSVMGGGFYKMSPRTHLLVGVVYLLLGGALIATSFGWSPFGGVFGSKDEPAPAPAKNGHATPVETAPSPAPPPSN